MGVNVNLVQITIFVAAQSLNSFIEVIAQPLVIVVSPASECKAGVGGCTASGSQSFQEEYTYTTQ